MKRTILIAGLAVLAGAAPAIALAAGTPASPAGSPPAGPQPAAVTAPATLDQALAIAYLTNPALQAQRAALRAADENVPAALAGWRPQVSISANAGYIQEGTIQHFTSPPPPYDVKTFGTRGSNSEALIVTQPLYNGGGTRASVAHARNLVMAQRASLISSEEQVLGNTVSAYVGVIQAQQVLALAINNEQVLSKQLQATNDRFSVGEITRTDVAQAQAALAGASAQRETAQANLKIADATFRQYVGLPPAPNLVAPQPLQPVATSQQGAMAMAVANNPAVIAALFQAAEAKDNFDLAYSKLMPSLSLQGQIAHNEDTQQQNLTTNLAQIVLQLSMPLYQGGSEYAAIRQARQMIQQALKSIDESKRNAGQQAAAAWNAYIGAKATIASTRQQIAANEVALEGVQREAIVGSRTTLDVLNAEQTLLDSRVTLVQNLATLVNASYSLAQAVGRLTARDLGLHVPIYNETAYYNAVKDKWIGTGDAATNQPGR
ncbi:MAG: TolC family outer membrane protein [Rhodospirillales bacterium]|nr:TolC family outer membrane protein [Rhodospirillales bacterium]